MRRNIKTKNIFIYALIAPAMILITIIGYTFRSEKKNNFYLPLGTVGIYLIFNKEFHRRLGRKNILKKIQFFKNNE